MLNIQEVRSNFPILTQKINGYPLAYLDNSATTQKPQRVIDSILSFYSQQNGNVHRSSYSLSEQASDLYESSRIIVKDFIHAKNSEEIVFTSGTTESINVVASSFCKKFIHENDEIIITEMEHHSNIVPWQQYCKEKNAEIKTISFTDQGVLRIDQFDELLTEKTKLVALTFVSNTLGTINPIKEIIHRAHKRDIPVLIDAAQAVQHVPINVQNLDCDFFVFSGHKMYAETGVGVLYAKEEWLDVLPPFKYGGGMVDKVSFEKTTFVKPPLKFEAGTCNISAAISLGAAIEYLNDIGIKNIQDYENDLVSYAMKQLESIDGLTIYGNPPQRCGIISFNLKKIHHYDAMMILDKMGIAVRSGKHCAEPVMDHYGISGMIRVSFALYNTREEIDRLMQGIKKVQEIHR